MSTHNTSNFVHELVTMAQAVEELPKLQAEIARLQALVNSQEYELSARESHVELLRNSNEELSSKLRSAEVERDNAGFRELAATDALDVLKRVMQTTFHNLGETLKAAQPVVEPTPTPIVNVDTTAFPYGGEMKVDAAGNTTLTPFPAEAQSDPVPTAPTTDAGSSGAGSGTADALGGASSITEASPSDATATGQSVTDPTSASSLPVPQTPVGVGGAVSSDDAGGVYKGKIYYDMPKYITEREWLNGGGSYEAYHWRPHFGARPAA